MTFQFIEVNPSEIELGSSNADKDCRYVYDHLKYCYTKNEIIPAFEVKEIGGRLISVNRHIYLAIAKDLNRQSTRAVVMEKTFDELQREGVRGLISQIPSDVLEREVGSVANSYWHIFFFKNQLSREVAEKIRVRFMEFLDLSLRDTLHVDSLPVTEFDFDISRSCLSIKFLTPASNYDWFRSFMAFCSCIDVELIPIATYQGSPWGGECSS